MPFKSEKQRRYLWANEPEIARDWTETYGSGIHKALGGRIPFQSGNFAQYAPYLQDNLPYNELDDLEAQAGLANMSQYVTEEEDEEENWLTRLFNRRNLGQLISSQVGKRLGLGMFAGLPGLLFTAFGGGGGGLGNLRGGHSQSYYSEGARENRRNLSRIADLKARRERGDPYSSKNLLNLLQRTGQTDDWIPPQIKKPRVVAKHGPHQYQGGGDRHGGGIPDVARDLGMKGSYDQGHT